MTDMREWVIIRIAVRNKIFRPVGNCEFMSTIYNVIDENQISSNIWSNVWKSIQSPVRGYELSIKNPMHRKILHGHKQHTQIQKQELLKELSK